jgi:hypothetical protein
VMVRPMPARSETWSFHIPPLRGNACSRTTGSPPAVWIRISSR